MEPSETSQAHLNTSELGTKEYWNQYYQNDLDQNADDNDQTRAVSNLESWFDDVDAPAKILTYLTSASFPMSPNNPTRVSSRPSVLDVGTGNGSTLLSLCLEGGYQGPMVGIDYSEQSIRLAQKVINQHMGSEEGSAIKLEGFDVIRQDPRKTPWFPKETSGFDLVMDKGTFDAISLSSETVQYGYGTVKRIFERYPEKVARLIRPGGFFLITSCNWTEDEVISWFTTGILKGVLEVYDTIKYPTFEFGGQNGQGVVSICFRKTQAAT